MANWTQERIPTAEVNQWMAVHLREVETIPGFEILAKSDVINGIECGRRIQHH